MQLNENSTVIFRGKKTHLYYIIRDLLKAGKPLRTKDLLYHVTSWHNFVPLMKLRTPEGERYFKHEMHNRGSYWQLTQAGFDQFVKETGIDVSAPEYLLDKPTDNQADDNKPNVHYVHYDMEVENTNTNDNKMKLIEAKEILKKNGYRLVEDTDDWDEADMPAGMSAKSRAAMVDKHGDEFRGLSYKRHEYGIWVLRILASTDNEDAFLGYLTPTFRIVKDVHDAYMNYNQVDDIYRKYTIGDEVKGKLKTEFRKKFPEYKTFWLEPGTLKKGKFYYKNIDTHI